MGKFNKFIIPISIVIVGIIIIIAGALVYINQGKTGGKIVGALSSQQAAEKAINYINQNMLQKGLTASLVNVAEENGIYKLRLKIGEQEYDSYITKDGKLLFTESPIDLESPQTAQPEEKPSATIGNFSISKDDICKENEKPIIYFFGSKGCSHCNWEHPIIEEVTAKFKENIVFHNNMDSDQDTGVFSKYSPGSIPTLVLGCKYYRVGSGESLGKETETKVLTALICKLTNNQPSETCDSVQDLISQIE